jgi:predicted alpha/beta hydrolase
MTNSIQSITIPAAIDGFPLGGFLLEPPATIHPKAIIQLNSATGVRKEFYLKFAHYLAHQGFIVVGFDYRGIGASRPRHLRGFEAYMRYWGERDMTGVLDWVQAQYPAVKKFVIGHSIGGQLIGLMPNHHLLSGIVTIASSSGYWRIMPAPYRYFTALIWYGFIPLTTALLGYAPAKRIGQGEDLPKGVAREWATWCKNDRYIASEFGATIQQHYYTDVQQPLKAYILEDDTIATHHTVPALLKLYTNADICVESIAPDDIGAKQIGHFGFFSERIGKPLWNRPVDWVHGLLNI